MSHNVARVTNRGHDASWGIGARIVYAAHLPNGLKFGLAYASKVNLKRFDKYEGLLAESGDFDIPQSFLAGFAFSPAKNWVIAVDYQRIGHEQIKTLSNASRFLVTCVAGQRDKCLGGSNGTGVGWRDIDVWKIGVQWDVSSEWTVRVGYSHTNNPITRADVTLNILAPAVVKDHYTAGFTYRFNSVPTDTSEVTAALVYAKKHSITGSSLFTAFGAPSTTVETISIKQYLLGLAYTRSF
jgi:long-chain fatty acid transport protein